MSRIGKMPITVPAGVVVRIENNQVTVKGPRGELSQHFHPDMTITLAEGKLSVTRPTDSKQHRALHGLTRSLLANMVTGVTTGFEKGLEIVGVGNRAEKTGDKLKVFVGFSHPVEVPPPKGIAFVVESPTRFKVTGADKGAVGQTAAEIRAIHPPDAYKGKGIRYAGERVRLKPGKTGGGKKE